MKIVVPVALSLAATLFAVLTTLLITRVLDRRQSPAEGAVAEPARAI